MSNKPKVWVEVALNGAWPRTLQPNIPVTAAEIIAEGVACVEAGAAIVHAHTLDPHSGRQNTDPDNCQAFIEGIRERVDAIVYPTAVALPMPEDAELRCATSNELRRRGALEWGILDPGSCNFSTRESAASLFGGDGDVYLNPPAALKGSAQQAARDARRAAGAFRNLAGTAFVGGRTQFASIAINDDVKLVLGVELQPCRDAETVPQRRCEQPHAGGGSDQREGL